MYHDVCGTLNGRQLEDGSLLYGCTCNMSLSIAMLHGLTFDTSFPRAAFEVRAKVPLHCQGFPHPWPGCLLSEHMIPDSFTVQCIAAPLCTAGDRRRTHSPLWEGKQHSAANASSMCLPWIWRRDHPPSECAALSLSSSAPRARQDVEFCVRARKHNVHLTYCAGAVVQHAFAPGANGLYKQFFRYGMFERHMCAKHPEYMSWLSVSSEISSFGRLPGLLAANDADGPPGGTSG